MIKKFIHVPVGIVVGIANGLFGAGGGTLLVPAMERLIGIETHKAHATALAVMLPLSVLSVLVYVWGVSVRWDIILYISAGGIAGGYLGAQWLNKLSSDWLHKIFGFFLVVAALRMIWS